MTAESQVLKRLDFPAYCVRVLENGLVAVAGGGGQAKTGVANCVELGTIEIEPGEKCRFNSLHKFEPNDAIMKFASFSFKRTSTSEGRSLKDIYIAAALNDSIEVYKIEPKVEKPSISVETDQVRNRKSKETKKEKAPPNYKTSASLKLVSLIKLNEKEEKEEEQESINTISVCKKLNGNQEDNSVLICAGGSKGNIHVWNLSNQNSFKQNSGSLY